MNVLVFQTCFILNIRIYHQKEPDGTTVCALRRAIAEVKWRWSVIGWVTKNLLSQALRVSEGTLSRWSRLYLQSLAPTNPHWARVVGYGPFSLCVIYKEGLSPSSEDINRQTMMIYHHTTHTIPEGTAETAQIFSRDTHVLPKWLSYEKYYRRNRW
jgi:hypothetical protein